MQRETKPKISVLMPAFNAERYVSQAIESIINQTFNDFELLIADDGSTDGSRKVIDKYVMRDERIKTFHNQCNIGKIDTLKRIYHKSRGEYVVFHDADDISHKCRFYHQISELDSDLDLGLVGTSYIMIDDRNKTINHVIPAKDHKEILRNIQKSSQFHFPTVMFRKRELDDEKYLFRNFFGNNNEDVDLTLRILTKSKGMNIHFPLYIYRILPSSISRSNPLRNSIYFFSIASDLAICRLNGGEDWLENKYLAANKLKEFEWMNDTKNVTIYANSISYFLSYRMFLKAFSVVYLSLGKISIVSSLKLSVVTAFRVFQNLVSNKKYPDFNLEEFLRRKYCSSNDK